jgi:hypothetical protein
VRQVRPVQGPTDVIVPEYWARSRIARVSVYDRDRIGGLISGDSLFGRHQDAAGVAVTDMAARLEEAGGLLIDAEWDDPFRCSLGVEPMPREDYLPLLGDPAERVALLPRPRPARRLLGPG